MRRSLILVVVAAIAGLRALADCASEEIQLYDEPNKSPEKAAELTGHTGKVLDAIYLPDGKLMTAGADGTLRTWDLASGKELSSVAAGSDLVTKLMLGPARDQVLAFHEKGAITVWKLPTPKRPWGPEQAIGPPDSSFGDQRTAWASETPDDQSEWLLLEYAEPVAAKAIRVVENFNPGAVVKVAIFDADGNETQAWAKDESDDGNKASSRRGEVRTADLPVAVDFPIKRVKLHIDSPAVRGWNEIDAVALIDGDGKPHWAMAAAASSTYSEQRGFRQPRIRMAPAPVYKIPEGATRLSHVDDTAEGKQSFGGAGHAVEFSRPRDVRYVVAIEVFGSRYGYPQPPDEDFEVLLLDEDFGSIKRLVYPYAMFERDEEKWVTLGVEGVEVPRRFHVALNFNAHQTKGVYVGKDEDVSKSHSLVGRLANGFKPVEEKFDWMIRVHLAKERPAATPPHEQRALSFALPAKNSAS